MKQIQYYVIAASAKQHSMQCTLLKTSEFLFMKYIGNKFAEELIACFHFTTILLLDTSRKNFSIYV
jgi:hypothetical protein